MTKDLEKRLSEEFPNLYKDIYGPMDKTCMHWGLECGDGWFDLIWRLSGKLESLIVEWMKQNLHISIPRTVQVKEKFGTLRFYMENGTNEMCKLIYEAEEESSIEKRKMKNVKHVKI